MWEVPGSTASRAQVKVVSEMMYTYPVCGLLKTQTRSSCLCDDVAEASDTYKNS